MLLFDSETSQGCRPGACRYSGYPGAGVRSARLLDVAAGPAPRVALAQPSVAIRAVTYASSRFSNARVVSSVFPQRCHGAGCSRCPTRRRGAGCQRLTRQQRSPAMHCLCRPRPAPIHRDDDQTQPGHPVPAHTTTVRQRSPVAQSLLQADPPEGPRGLPVAGGGSPLRDEPLNCINGLNRSGFGRDSGLPQLGAVRSLDQTRNGSNRVTALSLGVCTQLTCLP